MAEPGQQPLAPFAAPLGFAAILAAVAGYLDAVSLARLTGTFVAFQSGNTVLVGLGIGEGDWARVWPPAVSLVTYLVGSAAAVGLIRAGRGPGTGPQARLLLVSLVLLAIGAVLVLAEAGTGSARPAEWVRYLVIVCGAFAMALQTPVVRTVDGVPVASTFASGMLTRLGQSLGELVRAAAPRGERPIAKVLGVMNLAFLGGAVLGGVLIEAAGNLAAVVPVVTAAGMLIAAARRPEAHLGHERAA